MRKILIGVITILLIVMAVLMIIKGLQIGNLQILSAKQIVEENDKLTKEISQTELLMNTTYPTKTEELDKNVSALLTAKEEYQDLTEISTKSEISKATTEETYTVEFLWTRLGRHATAEGVNLNYTPSNNSISFTVVGDYIPIINFISAIENDSKLGFRIENFKMIPNGTSLQATFVTRNVKIKTESTSARTQTTTTTNKTTPNKTTTETTENKTTTETTQQ